MRAMPADDLYRAVAPFPERFNLCRYYLDRNVEEGRGDATALILGGERRSYGQIAGRAAQVAGALRRAGVRAPRPLARQSS